jgi:flagellar basal-body rod modification protein FlgD
MNALVAVRSNATGINNISKEKRAEVAKEVSASSTAKTMAALQKAGVVEKAADSTGTRTVNKELDRDAFLQLLTLQMQNQDPMSPMDNTQMVAQLAQFSSLEQMNTLNTSFTGLKTEMDHLNFLSTNNLIGRTILGADTDGNAVQGKVEKVVMLDGAVSVLAAGKTVPVESILQVE